MKFQDFASLTAEISAHGDPLKRLDEKIKYGEEAVVAMKKYRKAVAAMMGKSDAPERTVPRLSPLQSRQEILLMLKSQSQITPKEICKKFEVSSITADSYLKHQWFRKVSRGVYSLTKDGTDAARVLSTKNLVTGKESS